jgi:hypothetical protein
MSPTSATVPVNGTQQFTATVTGESNKFTTYSVKCTGTIPAQYCGTIDGKAVGDTVTIEGTTVYRAPVVNPYDMGFTGTINMVATSQADAKLVAEAPITLVDANTVSVSSTNSVTGQPVLASWKFINYAPTNPYGWATNPCVNQTCNNVSGQTYQALGAGNYQIASTKTPAGYTAGGILPTDNLILGAGRNIHFNIQWNPIGSMAAVPASLALDDTYVPSAQVHITNAGTAGSTVNWQIDPSSLPAWLSASSMSGTATISTPGTTTFTADRGALTNGTYTANVTFMATSAPGSNSVSPVTVPVTFIVSGAGSPPPPPGGGTVTGVSVSCSPTSILVGATSDCTAMVSGTGSFSSSTNWSVTSGGGSIANTGTNTAKYTAPPSIPGSQEIVSVNAASAQDPSKSGSAVITVNSSGGGGGPVSCSSFTANPNTVVPPGQSTLSWNCVNVPPGGCTISGVSGSFNSVGSTTVTMGSPTQFTLTCSSPGPGGGSTSTSVTVTTQQPGIIETAP